MTTATLFLAIFALALVGLGVWTILAFNRLVRYRNLVREAWSGIDVQLKRRHNLIPRLVEAVREYSAHERALFENVTELREQSRRTEQFKGRQDNENALSQVLRSLLAVAEGYPELKANRSFMDLQTQLSEVEDQIQFARRYYNGTVREYNVCAESFPSNVAAWVFGFRAAEFFEIETASERAVPRVEV